MKDKGCGVLFMIENGSGIIICGQKRADGNCFLCKRCLEDNEKVLRNSIAPHSNSPTASAEAEDLISVKEEFQK